MSITTPGPGRGGIGESVPRVDGRPKVTGEFPYASDLNREGMLWGETLRSPHPSARIHAIDVQGALRTPGVVAVLLAADVPGRKVFGLDALDQPVLAREVVRYAGEPVAIVAAEDHELAREAVRRIVVDYELLEPVTDMEAALRPDAPKLHPGGNVVRDLEIRHGDPDAPADVWVEGYYETGMQDQAPLGPEAGLAVPAQDGGVDLYVATQWLHADLEQIAPCLRLPEEKVRLHLSGVGGAFGAREDVSMQIHACLLALRTGRPVKIAYARQESFYGHVHRHPARIWMRHGARRDGTLVNVQARLVMDGGAYTSTSPAVIGNATTFAAGPYAVPNARLRGTAVFTNNLPCGAMRGFGAVQACIAYEAQMDRLAQALGMDPLALRLKNALHTGSVLPTGQVIHGAAPVRELIERCAALPMPPDESPLDRDPIRLPGGAGHTSHGEALARGVGFAVGYKNLAYSEGFDDSSEAWVRLSRDADGAIAEVKTAAVEVGQGLDTIVTQIARTELGVDRVVLRPPDTMIGSAGSSSASRQTMMTGGAVQLACQAVRAELERRIGSHAVPDVVEFLDPPIEAIRTYHHRATQPLDHDGQGDAHVTFAFGAARAVVEVDRELGLVRVVQLAVAQDVGRALNPQSVRGQVEGGSAQGLGFALMEEIELHEGRVRNASFTDYLIPTTLDMPPVLSALVEEPEPGVPFGAKGVGEPSTVVVPAAVLAALRAATGRALERAPVKPDDLVGLRAIPALRRPPP
ncbi:MAG TPA: molybdopterin cofactor-binding domain-containing protein [Candidatus Limnocylindrales bacterium]|nr:molybdopterin cofactor-binding domain-containing protein [Candidatus Limnocylindrales bacterium]